MFIETSIQLSHYLKSYQRKSGNHTFQFFSIPTNTCIKINAMKQSLPNNQQRSDEQRRV